MDVKCGKCGGPMEVGFVPDRNYSGTEFLTWFPGVPAAGTAEAKVDGKRYALMSYRCTGCGFVEFYAPKQSY